MMEEELTITCPCCSAEIYFDETGEPFSDGPELAELATNEFRGLGGLVSIDARPQWRQEGYAYNQQIVPTFDAPVIEEEEVHEQVLPDADPELEEASHKDLSKRNIRKSKTKTTN